jgi:hypothetical protein
VSCLVLLAAACFAPSATAAPPANDNFANATVLGPALPDEATGTNAEATAEPGETSHTGIPINPPPQSSVWYRWTPAADVPVAVLDICDNSSTPPGVFFNFAIYTGNSIATLGDPIAVGGGFTNSPSCSLRFAASAGTTYSIAVEVNKNVAIANFTVRLRQLTPPPNDNYGAATDVGPTLPVSAPATTIDATTQAGEPGVLGGAQGRSVWFKWTPGASGPVRIDACDFDIRSGDSNQAIGVYTDTNDSFPVGATVTESATCQVDFSAVSGQLYRIAYSGPVFGEGVFTLRIRSITPPTNDNFAGALPVGPALPIAVSSNNDFATGPQASEPIHGGTGGSNERSVWYTWTPTAAEAGGTDLIAFNVCNNDFDPNLGLYTGSTLATLNPVGTAPGGNSPYCYKLYDPAPGTTYRIAISSDDTPGDEGPFVLDIHRFQPPANDPFAAAQTIGPTLPIAVGGTTVDGTEQESAGEISHSGFNNPVHSVWYSWTAAISETVQIDTCGAPFESALSVYTGSPLNMLNRVALADEESCGFPDEGSRAALAATAGQTYRIAVDALDPGYWGQFTLRINGPSGTPATPPATTPPAGEPVNLKRAIKRCKKKFDAGKKRKKCIRKARQRALRS